METKKQNNPPETKTRPQATQPTETLVLCDEIVHGYVELHRAVLDACLAVPRLAAFTPENSNLDTVGGSLAASIVKLIRSHFANVKTGLEEATYLRFVLLSSGFRNPDSLIGGAVFGDKSPIPVTGIEFDQMSQHLGTLLMVEEKSRKFSISFRPVAAFRGDAINLRGIVADKDVESATELAQKQRAAFASGVTEADLVAYRESEAEAKLREDERKRAMIRKRKQEKREFERKAYGC